jgi:hypothetical protein
MNRTADLQITLTDDQVNFFNDNGYLRLDRFTTDEELDFLREAHDRVLENALVKNGYKGNDSENPPDFVWMHRPELECPELRETSCFRNALKLGTQLLNLEEAEIRISWRIFSKAPYYGPPVPWHQDEAYGQHSVNFWMPMDPATKASGCLHFIPGSNKGEMLPHRQLDTSGATLMVDGVDSSKAVACPVPPGGVSIHHCRTLHASPENRSSQPRRVFVIVCEIPAKDKDDASAKAGISRDARQKELEVRGTSKFFAYTRPRRSR